MLSLAVINKLTYVYVILGLRYHCVPEIKVTSLTAQSSDDVNPQMLPELLMMNKHILVAVRVNQCRGTQVYFGAFDPGSWGISQWLLIPFTFHDWFIPKVCC